MHRFFRSLLVLLSHKIRGFALGDDVLASAIHGQQEKLG